MENYKALTLDTNLRAMIAASNQDPAYTKKVMSSIYSKPSTSQNASPIAMSFSDRYNQGKFGSISSVHSAASTSEQSPSSSAECPLPATQRPGLVRQFSMPVDSRQKSIANYLHKNQEHSFWVEGLSEVPNSPDSPHDARPTGNLNRQNSFNVNNIVVYTKIR